MSKTYRYVIISVTMMLFLTFLGFQTGLTPLFNLINFNVDNSSGMIDNMSADVSTSNLNNFIFNNTPGNKGILMMLVGVVIIGLFARGQTENLLTVTFISGVLILFGQTFFFVLSAASDGTYPVWLTAVLFMTFLPITIGLFVSLVEWFKGVDN